MTRLTDVKDGVLVLALAMVSCGPSVARNTTANPTTRVREQRQAEESPGLAAHGPEIHLCWDQTQGVDQQWADFWNKGVARAIYDFSISYPLAARPTSMRTDETTECSSLAGRDCGAKPGHVYCQMDVLARVFHATALASAASASWLLEHDDSFSPVSGRVAFAIARSASQRSELPHWVNGIVGPTDSAPHRKLIAAETLAKSIGELYNRPADSVPGPAKDATEFVAGVMYKLAAWDVLSFLLGHELAHAHGRCEVEQPAHVEQTGMFKRVVQLQTSGPLCSATGVSPDELGADRCGLRLLQLTNRRLSTSVETAFEELGNVDRTPLKLLRQLAQRIAVDMFTQLAHEGLARQTGALSMEQQVPTAWFLPVARPGYLHEALRSYLLVATLRDGDAGPSLVKLCGESGVTFVFGVESAFDACQETLGTRAEPNQKEMTQVLRNSFSEYLSSAAVRGWASGKRWGQDGKDVSTEAFPCGEND